MIIIAVVVIEERKWEKSVERNWKRLKRKELRKDSLCIMRIMDAMMGQICSGCSSPLGDGPHLQRAVN